MAYGDNLHEAIGRLTATTIELSTSVNNMKDTMREEVLPAVRGIPVIIAREIKEHEYSCPLFMTVRDQAKEGLARKLRADSSPPAKVAGAAKTRLIQAIAALLLAAAGTLGGTQINSCSQPTEEVHDGN